MDKNILSGKIDELNKMKEELLELNTLKENVQKYTMDKQSLEKDVLAEEKLVEATISSTIKKRREELESGFNKEINNNQNKCKALKNKREATKKQAVDKRIKQETSELKNGNKAIHKEIKTVFKEKGVPRLCDSTLYYSLYSSNHIKEIILFAAIAVLFIALIPNIVCYLFKGALIWRILIYIAIVILEIVLYIAIYKLTMSKNKAVFEEIRPLREKIYQNNKIIRKIKKEIKSDTDESQYNLEEYDDEISSLEAAIKEMAGDKTKALNEFEEVTVKAITEEIINRSKENIEDMKQECVNLSNMLKELEKKQQENSLRIASDYEAYVGKEFMNIEKIDLLIAAIQDGKASTIAEAIGVVKVQS